MSFVCFIHANHINAPVIISYRHIWLYWCCSIKSITIFSTLKSLKIFRKKNFEKVCNYWMSWWRAAAGARGLEALGLWELLLRAAANFGVLGILAECFSRGRVPPHAPTNSLKVRPYFTFSSSEIHHSNRATITTENRNSAITTTNKSRWNSVESIRIYSPQGARRNRTDRAKPTTSIRVRISITYLLCITHHSMHPN